MLPDGWTVKKLLGNHSSSPFNPDIANAFFRAGEIEAWGRGIWRILQACKEAGAPKPRLRYETNDLWLEFPFAPEYLKTIQGANTEPEKPKPGPESGPESIASRILKLLKSHDLSKTEIASGLGHKTVSGKLNLRIRELLADHVIERTIPDKPNSRLQKYRLTAKGTSILAARRKERTR